MAEETPKDPAVASNPEVITPAPVPAQESAQQSDAPLTVEGETELERSQHTLDTSSVPHSGQISDDIAKILEEVKLPERRGMRGSADSKLPPPIAPATPPVQQSSAFITSAPSAPKTPPKEEQPQQSIVTPLHTLKDDVQRIVRQRHITTVRAVALEQEKKRPASQIPEEMARNGRRARRNLGLAFAIVVLFSLGCAALVGVYVISNERAAAPTVPVASILFAESTVSFPLDNQTPEQLRQIVASAEQTPQGAVGSILRIVPTISATSTNGTAQSAPATLQQFFTALGMNPPQDLYRSLSSQFFFGFYDAGQETPLFVIPVTSYEQAFADMLTWEPTMDGDLAPIFPSVSMSTTDQNGLPTQRTFQDDVMRNYDVRELKDDSGNIVLYYSFPTPDILVIASSPYTFTEVLNRLQAAREL